MVVWILIVKIMVAAPVAPRPLPYLAFKNQDDCENTLADLPKNAKGACVVFATDKIDDDE